MSTRSLMLFALFVCPAVATAADTWAVSVGGTAGGATRVEARYTEGQQPQPARVQRPAPVPNGSIMVENDAGAPLTITVDALSFETAPGERVLVSLPPGDHRVTASYLQFGVKQTYFSRDILVAPEAAITASIPRETVARVAITNPAPFGATLSLGGRELGRIEAGKTLIKSAPVGAQQVVLRFDNGTTDSEILGMAPYAEHRWTADPPPVTGDLLVQNPLPIPIELVCSRGLVRTVPAYGSTRYDGVPAGVFSLTARRVTDEPIDAEGLKVVPGRTVTWRVDAPTTGLVSIDNDLGVPSRVYIDGAPRLSLSAEHNQRLVLPLGWHRVTIRDAHGRELQDRWIEVKPYDTSTVHYGNDRARPQPVALNTTVSVGSSCTMPQR